MKVIKDAVGDLLGYAKCRNCNRTMMGVDVFSTFELIKLDADHSAYAACKSCWSRMDEHERDAFIAGERFRRSLI